MIHDNGTPCHDESRELATETDCSREALKEGITKDKGPIKSENCEVKNITNTKRARNEGCHGRKKISLLILIDLT